MKKILLIEDRDDEMGNLRELLELSNYAVISAPDGVQGLHMASTEIPDLIITDALLPGLDGYGVIQALQQYPETRSIPVIILTEPSGKDDFRRAMTAGADDLLAKPFDGIELLRSVEACLERHRHRSGMLPGVPTHHHDPVAQETPPWQAGDREIRACKRKSILYSEGQRASQVWYIVKGRIKTFLINTDGKELITHIYGPGDCVGYIAAIHGGTYKDNAQVLDDAGLIIISRPEFLSILASDSALSQQLIKWLARNATEQEAGLLNLAYSSLRKKVANGLLYLFDSFHSEEGGRSFVMVSRDNLAAIIGAAPESLSRTLSDFRKEKLIDVEDGRIYLLNEARLRKMIN
jgi:DNA-binding response OmpR family regulator